MIFLCRSNALPIDQALRDVLAAALGGLGSEEERQKTINRAAMMIRAKGRRKACPYDARLCA